MLFGQYLNTHRVFKRLAKALSRLHVCAGWSEPLRVAHTTLLEISCRGSTMKHSCLRKNIEKMENVIQCNILWILLCLWYKYELGKSSYYFISISPFALYIFFLPRDGVLNILMHLAILFSSVCFLFSIYAEFCFILHHRHIQTMLSLRFGTCIMIRITQIISKYQFHTAL